MKSLQSILSFTLLATVVLLTSCGKDDPTPALQATIFSNLAADPATGYDPGTGAPIGYTGKYKLFSFSTGDVVANTDSATSNWDIGFRGTSIIVNSGTSGPGTAGAIVQTEIFDEIVTAPNAGYNVDNKNTPAYAIPTGSGNGWYNYDGATMLVSPIAGRVIIIKTANGKFAKMEILSYYKDAPAAPNAMTDAARYFSLRYIFQPDGSKNLK
jgi:hypothetical protein